MDIIRPRTLSGFMELLPGKQIQFERMAQILRSTYASYGFAPLDTPIIEDAQILLAKGGGETEKQIYRFTKGDSDLALRFDLTVPLAKYVALHCNDLAFPFRRFQISKVYRGERAQRGRFREFYQADIDIIGDGKLDILNEAEIPAIIYKVFKGFGLTRFQIRVNNRKILNGFYAMNDLAEKSGEIMRTVDKLDKIGAEKMEIAVEQVYAVIPAIVKPVFPKDFIEQIIQEVFDKMISLYGEYFKKAKSSQGPLAMYSNFLTRYVLVPMYADYKDAFTWQDIP